MASSYKSADEQLTLSDELASAEWVAVAEAPEKMWPASAENAALKVLEQYLEQIK
jgi:NAD+ diphosphatase